MCWCGCVMHLCWCRRVCIWHKCLPSLTGSIRAKCEAVALHCEHNHINTNASPRLALCRCKCDFRWKTICEQKHLTAEMNISKRSLSCILREDYCLGTYTHCVSFIRRKTQKRCYKMCKKLLKRFQKMHDTESCLPIKRFSVSKRNSIAKITTYMPKVVMRPKTKSQEFREIITIVIIVWWSVSYSGTTRIHFCDAGVKTNGEVYRAVLNDALGGNCIHRRR